MSSLEILLEQKQNIENSIRTYHFLMSNTNDMEVAYKYAKLGIKLKKALTDVNKQIKLGSENTKTYLMEIA